MTVKWKPRLTQKSLLLSTNDHFHFPQPSGLDPCYAWVKSHEEQLSLRKNPVLFIFVYFNCVMSFIAFMNNNIKPKLLGPTHICVLLVRRRNHPWEFECTYDTLDIWDIQMSMQSASSWGYTKLCSKGLFHLSQMAIQLGTFSLIHKIYCHQMNLCHCWYIFSFWYYFTKLIYEDTRDSSFLMNFYRFLENYQNKKVTMVQSFMQKSENFEILVP